MFYLEDRVKYIGFLGLLISMVACGPSYSPAQPYYQNQPVIVDPVGPIVVPMAPSAPVWMPNRVTTTTRTRVIAPVRQQQAQQPRAQQQPSQYQQQAAPATQNLSDRQGMVRSFKVQQGAQQAATGFGAKATVSAPKSTVSPRPAPQFRSPSKR